jgi:hypothetical protein
MNRNMTAGLKILLAVMIAATPAIALARASNVPIMLGGNDDYDACGSAGVISGLSPRGDGFLSVRSGPGVNYAEMDRLYNGNAVQICDRRGGWMAVVYGGGRDCGVSSPWPKRLAYTGPCKYGWVASRYVTVTAG